MSKEKKLKNFNPKSKTIIKNILEGAFFEWYRLLFFKGSYTMVLKLVVTQNMLRTYVKKLFLRKKTIRDFSWSYQMWTDQITDIAPYVRAFSWVTL